MEIVKIKVLDVVERKHIVHHITCNCPNCGLDYNVTIYPNEDNFKVKCIKCKKFFMAKRE